jgi:hypothetical protein
VVSLGILDQKNQMMPPAVFRGWIFGMQIIRSHVHLAADDRLNSSFFGFDKKFHRAVHYAMISQGYRIHSEFFGMVKQVVDLAETI